MSISASIIAHLFIYEMNLASLSMQVHLLMSYADVYIPILIIIKYLYFSKYVHGKEPLYGDRDVLSNTAVLWTSKNVSVDGSLM
jgi:hypothetical protein